MTIRRPPTCTCRRGRGRTVPVSFPSPEMISARSTNRASLMTSAPPSPEITFFVSWKLRRRQVPEATERPSLVLGHQRMRGVLDHDQMRDDAQSPSARPSRTPRPRSAPATIALVRGVMADSSRAPSMFSVSGRMSTKPAVAPRKHERVGRRHERERRHDHFVAGTEIEQQRCHLERRRTRLCQQHARRPTRRSSQAWHNLVKRPLPASCPAATAS